MTDRVTESSVIRGVRQYLDATGREQIAHGAISKAPTPSPI
jgi:hypothetical protein